MAEHPALFWGRGKAVEQAFCVFVNALLKWSATRLVPNSAPTGHRKANQGRVVLEILCGRDCDVEVVELDDLRVLRVSDILAGVIINVPLTAMALADLVSDVPFAA